MTDHKHTDSLLDRTASRSPSSPQSSSLDPAEARRLAEYLAVTEEGYRPWSASVAAQPLSSRSTGYPPPNPANSLVQTFRPNPADSLPGKFKRSAKRAERESFKWALKSRMIGVYRRWANEAPGPRQKYAASKLLAVESCPGNSHQVEHHGETWREFTPNFCRELACPFSAEARSINIAAAMRYVFAAGLMPNAKMIVFAPPNVADPSNQAVRDLSKALTLVHRRSSWSEVTGGFETIEEEQAPGRTDFNVHANSVVSSGYIAHYPVTDLRYMPAAAGEGRSWEITSGGGNMAKDKRITLRSHGGLIRHPDGRAAVARRHAGLARDFTAACQATRTYKASCYSLADSATKLSCDHLPGRCVPFDIDNPDHWYFVDIQRADADSAAELGKYITKQSTLLLRDSDSDVMWKFIQSVKGNRMFRAFGEVYKHVRINARYGIVELVKTCDAKLDTGRPCNTKNDLRALSCSKCGAVLELTQREAELAYAEEMAEIDAPTADLADPATPVDEFANRECIRPDCDDPAPVTRKFLGVGSVWHLHGPGALAQKINGRWVVVASGGSP